MRRAVPAFIQALALIAALAIPATAAQPDQSRGIVTPHRVTTSLAGDLGVHNARQAAQVNASNPQNGQKNWIVLRCKYQTGWTGRTSEQNTTSYFNTMFSSATPGIANYWNKASYGHITINTIVAGGASEWRAMPHPNSSYGFQDSSPSANTIHITASFDTLASDCAQAWDNGITYNANTFYAFTLDQTPGACGVGGFFNINKDGLQGVNGTLIGSCQDDEALWVHEMGHAFGLQHSESGDSDAQGNLYDTDYDELSAPSGACGSWWNANGSDPRVNRTINFGCIPGGLLAYHKAEVLGWIAPSRVYTNTPGAHTITLERVADPVSTTNYLMAKIIQDNSTYYTVEARFKTGLSSALVTGYDENIPGACCYEAGQPNPPAMVVINKIWKDSFGATHITLVGTDDNNDGTWDDPGSQWMPGETFTAASGTIKVQVVSKGTSSFNVTLTSPVLNGFNYYPLTHVTLLNTQTGVGAPVAKLGAAQTLNVKVTGVGGVPASVGAVVLNLKAAGATAGSAITAWTTGTTRPGSTVLQLQPNRSSNNLITVQPNASGFISLYNSGGLVNLQADVYGYYGPRTGGLRFNPVYPFLASYNGLLSIPPGGSATFDARPNIRIPATDVSAVVIQINNQGNYGAGGSLTIYPDGAAKPALPDIIYGPNDFHATMLIVPVGSTGKIRLFNNGTVTTYVEGEMLGWFGQNTGLSFRPINGVRVNSSLIAGGAQKTIDLTGVGGVPASGALAVLANATAYSPVGSSLLDYRPADEPLYNYGGHDVAYSSRDANAVLANVADTTGEVIIKNLYSQTQVATDVFGWFGN
jgi:M6 family metalloprotease-like protein